MSADLKHTCHECDGHISYPEHAKGMEVACPHCGKSTSLGEIYCAPPVRAQAPPVPTVPSPVPPARRSNDVPKWGIALLAVACVVLLVGLALTFAHLRKRGDAPKSGSTKGAASGQTSRHNMSDEDLARTLADRGASVTALMRPEVTHLPPGFEQEWVWNTTAMSILSGRPDNAIELAVTMAERVAKNPNSGHFNTNQAFALVVREDYHLRCDVLAKFGSASAVARIRYAVGLNSKGTDQFWVVHKTKTPNGSYVGKNAFGVEAKVDTYHELTHWFYNVNAKAPAIEVAGGYDTSSEHSKWDADDLRRRMFPVRSPDGSRKVNGAESGSQRLVRELWPPGGDNRDSLLTFAALPKTMAEEDVGKRIGIVLLFHLASPFLESSERDEKSQKRLNQVYRENGYSKGPTLDDPNEVTSSASRDLYGHVFEAVFYDIQGRAILARVDMSKPISERIPPVLFELDRAREAAAAQVVLDAKNVTAQNSIVACELALRYAVGDGFPKDIATAEKVVMQAAQFMAPAQKCQMALRYAIGDGFPKDMAVAKKLMLGVSAAGSSPDSELGRAWALIQAEMDKFKMTEADKRVVESFKKQAATGSDRAQYELGLRYLAGKSIEKDEAEGLRLLRAAAAQNNEAAKKKLAELGEEPK